MELGTCSLEGVGQERGGSMKVLVTGTEGYLGSLLAPELERRGHSVVGLDLGYYKTGCLFATADSTPKTICRDVRDVGADDLRGFEAVVHLAELSNDPAGQLVPEITYAINHQGSVTLAKAAKAAGVSRFVYTSSCSVYGVATEDMVTEESALNPQTAYAVCKTLVERDVAKMADDDFSPTFLRNATAFGPSPRMRFDIVVNNLTGYAWTEHEIRMVSDGTPWRPLVHALDICHAVSCSLEAPRDAVHNQIFNVGATEANFRVREIAEMIAEVFAGCRTSFGQRGSDNRSYRVSFEKIHSLLPGFKCEWTLQDGIRQLRDLYERIELTKEMFESPAFTRLKQLEYLLRTRQLDERFRWTVSQTPSRAVHAG